MALHSSLTDTQIARVTTAPSTAPGFTGFVVAEINSDATINNCLRVATGTSGASDYKVVAFLPQTYTGDPNGNKTARCPYDLCIDTVNSREYFSETTGSTSWTLLT